MTMPGQDLKIDSRDWMLLVLLSVLWGGSFFFVGAAIREVPPLTIVFLRVGVAALVLLPLVLMRGIAFPSGFAGWKVFLVMSAINNVIPFSLQAGAQVYITSGLASVLNATTPLFTVLVMSAFSEERLVPRRIAGVLLGLLGVVILRGQGLDLTSNQTIGMLMCLGATLSYGFSALWAKRHMTGIPPLGAAAFQMMTSCLLMAVLSFTFERPWELPVPSASATLAIVGTGVLSTAVGFIIFFQIIARSGPSNVMLVTLLVPVSAILLGHFLLGEVIVTREYIGAIIIAAALIVMDGRVFGLFRRKPVAAAGVES
jgi:drug/metabolite transporter (DMT)-like permease